jgi:hypothetical protein
MESNSNLKKITDYVLQSTVEESMRRETMMRDTYIKIEFPAWRNGVVEATIGRLFVPKQGLVDEKDDAETKVDAIMSVRVVARYCKVQFLPVLSLQYASR